MDANRSYVWLSHLKQRCVSSLGIDKTAVPNDCRVITESLKKYGAAIELMQRLLWFPSDRYDCWNRKRSAVKKAVKNFSFKLYLLCALLFFK